MSFRHKQTKATSKFSTVTSCTDVVWLAIAWVFVPMGRDTQAGTIRDEMAMTWGLGPPVTEAVGGSANYCGNNKAF